MSRVQVICEVCGKAYDVHHSRIGKTHTCGRECANQRLRKHVDGEAISRMYKSGMSSIEIGKQTGVSGKTIVNCLNEMGIPLRSNTAHLWTDKNPTRGKGHSDEVKKRLRALTKQQFLDPKARELASHNQCLYLAKNIVSSVSGVENRVADELDRRGVQYQRQVPVRDPVTGRYGACVDFMVNGVVLEVNGTFWHCDRRVYPNGPQNESQRRTAAAYARKMALLERLKIKVVEVWEKDVDESVSCAVDKVMEVCNG